MPKNFMASLKKFLRSQGFQVLEMERTQTEHFAIEAELNGVSGRFIVDTGASNTCVGLDRIAHFGMESEGSEIKAAGAGSSELETAVSAGNRLLIGAWERTDLQMVLIDLSHVNQALTAHEALPVDGILGADVLRLGRAVIDYHKNCLFLK